jgi:hypothetical protein
MMYAVDASIIDKTDDDLVSRLLVSWAACVAPEPVICMAWTDLPNAQTCLIWR